MAELKKVRAPDLKKMKRRGKKIVMLTAYDAGMARLLDRAGVDVLLVGDTVGMVVLGHDTTIPVTLGDILHHTKAVTRGTSRPLVVADMPFMTFQVSVEDALRNAGRLIQEGGASAVKMEGGRAGGRGGSALGGRWDSRDGAFGAVAAVYPPARRFS